MRRALIFDCDGVLADTELHGHLVAFNQMWENCGVPWHWSNEQYGEKLKIGGGKERMASLFQDPDFCRRVSLPAKISERTALVAEWHKEKTEIYERIIASGNIPARPGVKRLSKAALEAGWRVAVASTSGQVAVSAVVRHVLPDVADQFEIFAGDLVAAKKPSPEIYNLAVHQLGTVPELCVAIEDSRNGLLAAYGAKIPTVITVSEYTTTEDFSEARLVVDCLGDPGTVDCKVLANKMGREIGTFVTLADIENMLGTEPHY